MFAAELLLCIIHPPGLYLLGIIRKPIMQRAAGLLGSRKLPVPKGSCSFGGGGFPNPISCSLISLKGRSEAPHYVWEMPQIQVEDMDTWWPCGLKWDHPKMIHRAQESSHLIWIISEQAVFLLLGSEGSDTFHTPKITALLCSWTPPEEAAKEAPIQHMFPHYSAGALFAPF